MHKKTLQIVTEMIATYPHLIKTKKELINFIGILLIFAKYHKLEYGVDFTISYTRGGFLVINEPTFEDLLDKLEKIAKKKYGK